MILWQLRCALKRSAALFCCIAGRAHVPLWRRGKAMAGGGRDSNRSTTERPRPRSVSVTAVCISCALRNAARPRNAAGQHHGTASQESQIMSAQQKGRPLDSLYQQPDPVTVSDATPRLHVFRECRTRQESYNAPCSWPHHETALRVLTCIFTLRHHGTLLLAARASDLAWAWRRSQNPRT